MAPDWPACDSASATRLCLPGAALSSATQAVQARHRWGPDHSWRVRTFETESRVVEAGMLLIRMVPGSQTCQVMLPGTAGPVLLRVAGGMADEPSLEWPDREWS
jgi:hypothetical protein